METVAFKGSYYPKLQADGNAMQFAIPFAQKFCKGNGLDIGCAKLEWCFPEAIPIDPVINEFDAYNLPSGEFDYIISSHCIEHLPNWVAALEYWHTKLKKGGVLFLYLPNMDLQVYWRAWHNKKHVHYLSPVILKKYFEDNKEMWGSALVIGSDPNYSFYAIAEKI